MESKINPVLAGQKALIVGIANDQSIAYGCAKAFRAAGADLAITWLNDVGWACAYLATPFAHRITGGTVYVDSGANIIA
jgi:enoyl-[acyl-carrier-protein] reductase (NADH)